MDSEGSVLQEKPHLPVIVWCRQHKNAGRGTGRRTEPTLAALTLTAGGARPISAVRRWLGAEAQGEWGRLCSAGSIVFLCIGEEKV